MLPSMNTLELELRKLSGVVGVGVERVDGMLLVELLAEPAAGSILVRAAGEVVRKHAHGEVILSVTSATPVAPVTGVRRRGEPERIRFVGLERRDRNVDVWLTLHGNQVMGRDSSRGVGAAARATLAALDRLDLDIPFALDVITESTAPGGAVTTVLVRLAAKGSELLRLGVARAATADEAASRAVLDALNRYLSDTRPGMGPAARNGY